MYLNVPNREARDVGVAVILLDFILGYNASMDPVGELVVAIQEGKKIAAAGGRRLDFVASVCGTEGDPQDLNMQIRLLHDCGVTVFRTNAQAVSYWARLLSEVNHG